MSQLEFIKFVFGLSGCTWMLIWLFVHLSVMRFIVPRYEEETGLIDTVYFKKLMPFAKYIPSFWSSIFYIVHLANFMWFWRWIQHSKIYRDIDCAEEITGKFSAKEIRRVKLQIVSIIIAGIHLIAVSFVDW